MIYFCCVVNADCSNTPGSQNCSCKAGYSGDGKSCIDAFFNRNRKINFQHPQSHEHVSLFTLVIDIQLVNPLTLGVFCQNAFFEHFGVFSLDMSQISSNLLKKQTLFWRTENTMSFQSKAFPVIHQSADSRFPDQSGECSCPR